MQGYNCSCLIHDCLANLNCSSTTFTALQKLARSYAIRKKWSTKFTLGGHPLQAHGLKLHLTRLFVTLMVILEEILEKADF